MLHFFCSFFLPINIANGHQTHNSSETTAGRITADNFSLRAIRGIDAIGGIDDWFLTNGTLCATISDKKHETYLFRVYSRFKKEYRSRTVFNYQLIYLWL